VEYLIVVLKSGVAALAEYLSAHVLTCLVPALFIAGAISTFISKGWVTRYFSTKVSKGLSYGVASVSGAILAVCSCTVLPLFAGLYSAGAALGPAVAFLYAAPAINVLAAVYSARLLGLHLGIARAVGAVVLSIVIGALMALVFRRSEKERVTELAVADPQEKPAKSSVQLLAFFLSLVGILIFGAGKMWVYAGASLAVLGLVLWRWFAAPEVRYWLRATWAFVLQITPWLLAGVFLAGCLKAIVPETAIRAVVGGNTVAGNLAASAFGAVMYFATLTEVPIIKALLQLGMGRGPALSLLLAGPALSLPSMLAIGAILGAKKALTYIALVVIFSALAGLAFGHFAV
jgi:hypothetical protein